MTPASRSASASNGWRLGERVDRRGERLGRAAVAAQRLERRLRRLAVGQRVGRAATPLGDSCIVLAGVAELARVELGDLEPEQVDLAGAGLLVAAQRRQLGVDLGHAGAGRAERARSIDPNASSALALGDP